MHEHDDLQQRLGVLGTHPISSAQQSADLTAMAQARPMRPRASKLRLAGAFLAGLLLGGTGLAAADALPDPAQHVAHTTLAKVGVDVPNPARYHGPECGPEQKNHGAYVSQASGPDKKTMAKSDCGKPLEGAGAADGEGVEDQPGKADDPCHGKPAWAGDKTLSDEARAAAKETRKAECGGDDQADENGKSEHGEEPGAAGTNDGTPKPDKVEDRGHEDDAGELGRRPALPGRSAMSSSHR